MVMAKIKAGYKKTDIGVIPEDWDIKLVSDLCDIVSGGTPSTANPTFWIKGDIPWCIPSDITETSGKYLYKTDRNITSLGLSKSSANLLPEGSLLLCSRATIGEIKVAKTEITTNQGFKSLVCHSVDNEFMYYKVLTLKEQLLQLSTGSTFLEFSKKDISRLQIDVPKPKEQKAIAGALSDVDGLIESLEKLIAKKRDMKTATMQQLLTGKKRLSGFGDSFTTQETIFGKVPKDWQIKTLQSLCTFENGDRGSNYPSKSDFQLTGVPFVNAGHLKNKKVQLDDMDFITYEKYDQLGNGKFKIGDILFCLRGSLGKYAVIKKSNLFGAIASSLIIIKPKKGLLDSAFFEFYLESEHCEKMIDLFAGGAAQPNLGGQDLSKFFILLPSTPEEQKAIAQILSDMDAEIESLEKRLEKVHNLKIGMMQELLTGKTRLIKADKI